MQSSAYLPAHDLGGSCPREDVNSSLRSQEQEGAQVIGLITVSVQSEKFTSLQAPSCCAVLSRSVVSPWPVTRQVPLSMGFSRQEYWSGLPFLPPGDLPNPGIEPRSY